MLVPLTEIPGGPMKVELENPAPLWQQGRLPSSTRL